MGGSASKVADSASKVAVSAKQAAASAKEAIAMAKDATARAKRAADVMKMKYEIAQKGAKQLSDKLKIGFNNMNTTMKEGVVQMKIAVEKGTTVLQDVGEDVKKTLAMIDGIGLKTKKFCDYMLGCLKEASKMKLAFKVLFAVVNLVIVCRKFRQGKIDGTGKKSGKGKAKEEEEEEMRKERAKDRRDANRRKAAREEDEAQEARKRRARQEDDEREENRKRDKQEEEERVRSQGLLRMMKEKDGGSQDDFNDNKRGRWRKRKRRGVTRGKKYKKKGERKEDSSWRNVC